MSRIAEPDYRGYAALHWIVAQPPLEAGDQIEGIGLLIAAGADPNARNQKGLTPLMNAAWFGFDAGARELLARGADPSAADSQNRTARSMALQRGHPRLAAPR